MRRMFYIVTLLFTLLTACRPDDEPPADITIKPLRITSSFLGGVDSIEVAATSTKWSATCDAHWVELKRKGDKWLMVEMKVNLTTAAREATIELVCNNSKAFVRVEQAPNQRPLQTRDSMALISIYNKCGGDNWHYLPENNDRPWKVELSIPNWLGITTETIAGQVRVVALDVRGFGLIDSLPSAILDLTELQTLRVAGNQLIGKPMDILSKMKSLIVLDIGYNLFEGVADIENKEAFANLRSYNISGLDLGGRWPSYLGNMTGLLSLSMSGCNIGSGFDNSLQKLTHLMELNLSDNPITGSIPSWITSLSNLSQIDISMCGLSGSIPNEIGLLSELTTFKAGYNQLSGAMPQSIGDLTKVEIINISDNQITSLGEQIGNCRSLKYLDFSHNKVTELPSQIGDLPLQILDGSANLISGHIPQSLWENRTLQLLNLSANKIEGPIWASIGGNQALEMLILNNNLMTGNIPSSIVNAKNLNKLIVSQNNLSGKLPVGITSDIRYTGYDANYPPDDVNPDWTTIHIEGSWNPKSDILPQNDGYKLTE